MGYYINCESAKGKAVYLMDVYGAERIPAVYHDSIESLPEDKALICVVDNGSFEAAGLMYDQKELDSFALDGTGRPKTWLLLDRATAYELAGYKA